MLMETATGKKSLNGFSTFTIYKQIILSIGWNIRLKTKSKLTSSHSCGEVRFILTENDGIMSFGSG